jgi:hypothetical protein
LHRIYNIPTTMDRINGFVTVTKATALKIRVDNSVQVEAVAKRRHLLHLYTQL